MKRYIVSEVPADKTPGGCPVRLYYCHAEGFPDIPVFGSIGSKEDAARVCRMYNLDGKAHYGDK